MRLEGNAVRRDDAREYEQHVDERVPVRLGFVLWLNEALVSLFFFDHLDYLALEHFAELGVLLHGLAEPDAEHFVRVLIRHLLSLIRLIYETLQVNCFSPL